MTPEFIEKKGIVDRYLLGQLTSEELHEFELYLFENPEFLDEVKMQEAMIKGMKADPVLAGHKTVTRVPSSIGWLRTLTSPLIAAAAAATVTAVAFTLFTATPNGDTIRVITEQHRLELRQTRNGAAVPAEIERSATADGLLLVMELGPVGYPSVGLQLRATDREWSWDRLVTPSGPTARIEVLLPQPLALAGDYEIRIYPPDDDPANTIAVFSFQINP